jgi:HAD superfamily hydrolase (TIGR01509 family)
VASSAAHEKIFTTLSRVGLYQRFAPNIFSGTQVSFGKPAPDLFLFAAGQMAATPQRCVVVEDSIPGITGALAAGMTVLGFHGGGHCRPGDAKALRAPAPS